MSQTQLPHASKRPWHVIGRKNLQVFGRMWNFKYGTVDINLTAVTEVHELKTLHIGEHGNLISVTFVWANDPEDWLHGITALRAPYHIDPDENNF